MNRAVVVVIDSMGIGAMPDACEYGDVRECNTLVNVAKANNGLCLPNLEKMGIGNLAEIEGVKKVDNPSASVGILKELSKGKDTTTGHWEIAGLVLEKPFLTYPEGFPKELIDEFVKETGCGGVLGNYPASGTKIIEELASEHEKTKFPIVYTSADSVFQIACDVDVIPLETLYRWCEIARKLLDGKYNVSRVIARPYHKVDCGYQRISKDRRDYSVPPTGKTVLDAVKEQNGRVLGVGKIEDIFVKTGITHAIHTGSNKEGLEILLSVLENRFDYDKYQTDKNFSECDKEFIFVNLVDTDMLFGHRNDAVGYGRAIEEIDSYVDKFLNLLTDEDLFIITADHGCDPTVSGTDHTREMIPVVLYSKSLKPKNLEITEGFGRIASSVAKWLGVDFECNSDALF